MPEFTDEERARLRVLIRAFPDGRLEKAIACLDELGPPDRIRAVIAGLSENSDSAGELRAVVRVIRWLRWTQEGAAAVKWWLAMAGLGWVMFQDEIKEWVRAWLEN